MTCEWAEKNKSFTSYSSSFFLKNSKACESNVYLAMYKRLLTKVFDRISRDFACRVTDIRGFLNETSIEIESWIPLKIHSVDADEFSEITSGQRCRCVVSFRLFIYGNRRCGSNATENFHHIMAGRRETQLIVITGEPSLRPLPSVLWFLPFAFRCWIDIKRQGVAQSAAGLEDFFFVYGVQTLLFSFMKIAHKRKKSFHFPRVITEVIKRHQENKMIAVCVYNVTLFVITRQGNTKMIFKRFRLPHLTRIEVQIAHWGPRDRAQN